MRPILVVIPTLNRPCQLAEAIACLTVNMSGNLADFYILTGDDHPAQLYNSIPADLLCQYSVIGFMADDVRMRTYGWDALVMQYLDGRIGLVYGSDGIQDQRLCTHPFMSTAVPLELGFILPPGFKHGYYGDNFWHELFSDLGAMNYVREIIVEHLHPSAGKSPYDETYRRAEQFLQSDKEAWERYKRTQFQADKERIARLIGKA